MAELNHTIIQRYKNNPILTKNNVPYSVATIHNACVIKYNGKYMMLFRSHLHNGRSIIGIAESKDGFNFEVRQEPFIIPSKTEPFACYEEYGVEDPRICLIENDYFITYSVYSKFGVRIALAKTKDFKQLDATL